MSDFEQKKKEQKSEFPTLAYLLFRLRKKLRFLIYHDLFQDKMWINNINSGERAIHTVLYSV